jgi:hypothetical protein
MIKIVCNHLVPEHQRSSHVAKLFGHHFPLRLEPFVFAITERLAKQYSGGYWSFFALCNGGFYMAPQSDTMFNVSCENGFEGKLSADALGITACLYAYSNLSFGGGEFAQKCAQQYHLLRDYAMDHSEVGAIFGAID